MSKTFTRNQEIRLTNPAAFERLKDESWYNRLPKLGTKGKVLAREGGLTKNPGDGYLVKFKGYGNALYVLASDIDLV